MASVHPNQGLTTFKAMYCSREVGSLRDPYQRPLPRKVMAENYATMASFSALSDTTKGINFAASSPTVPFATKISRKRRAVPVEDIAERVLAQWAFKRSETHHRYAERIEAERHRCAQLLKEEKLSHKMFQETMQQNTDIMLEAFSVFKRLGDVLEVEQKRGLSQERPQTTDPPRPKKATSQTPVQADDTPTQENPP